MGIGNSWLYGHLFFNLKETSIPLISRMFLHQVRNGWVFPILQKKKKKDSMSLPRSKPTTFKRDAFQELSSSLRAVTLFVFFITVSWRSRRVFGTCQASINICWTNEQGYEWRSSHRENPIAIQMGVTTKILFPFPVSLSMVILFIHLQSHSSSSPLSSNSKPFFSSLNPPD